MFRSPNLGLFKDKNFTILIVGQFMSLLGSLMQSFALGLYVLQITSSSTKFATVIAVSMVVKLFLGPICGVFADWFDRKKIMIYLDIISGILLSAVFIESFFTEINMIHVYFIVITLSIISSLYTPTVNTIIPTIIEKDKLIKANSIETVTTTLSNLLAPILAVLVFSFFGIKFIFIVNAISFIFSAILEMFITLPLKEKLQATNVSFKQFKIDFKEGISFVIHKKYILKLLICATIVNIVLNPITSIGIPVICKITLKVSNIQYGTCESIIVIGALLGPILISKFYDKMDIEKLFFGVLIVSGGLFAIASFVLSPKYLNLFNSNINPFILFTIIMFLIVVLIMMLNIVLFSMIQKEIPNELMGRVFSVINTVTMAAIPLGQLLFGFLFDNSGSFIPVLIVSIVLILVSFLFRFFMKNDASIGDDKNTISIIDNEVCIDSPELAKAVQEK